MSVIRKLHFPLALVLLLSALLLGGGQGTLGDTFCQLLALALIGLSLWRHAADPEGKLPRVAWLAVLPLMLPLLQLLPIPQLLWSWPQARVEIAAELATAGVDPASRLSLVPLATERALAWLLPGVAMFLAGLQFVVRQRVVLVAVFVAVASAAVVLGLAQLAGGSESGLRFYEITNINGAVGFFANRNHHASFMAMALPFAMLATAWWLARREREYADAGQWLWLAAGVGLVTLVILGIAITNSRAGLVLGMLGFVLAIPAVFLFRRRRDGGPRRYLGVALALGATLTVQLVLVSVLQMSLGPDAPEDARFRFTPITLAAASAHAPLGAGLGGFEDAFETHDTAAPGNVYVNHAHNDLAELWLDGGWLAVLLALPLLAAFLWAGSRVWQPGDSADERAERLLRQAAWIALTLVLLHSVVDYPLRTTAHLALFGLLAALLSRVPAKTPSESRSLA